MCLGTWTSRATFWELLKTGMASGTVGIQAAGTVIRPGQSLSVTTYRKLEKHPCLFNVS